MLRIPTGRLKREWSLLAIFGRANRSYRDISNTWLGHGFLSPYPFAPPTLFCRGRVCRRGEASKTEWLSQKCKLLFRASVTWLTHLLPVPP
jgi:hypothetical protein